jgi:predicted RNA-binding Zn-ribbon protein involved in translation (DUF1610 family)
MEGLVIFGVIGVVVFIIAALVIAMKVEKKSGPMIRCPNCQYEGPGKKWAEGCGPQLLELALFLFFIIPWLIFKAFTANKLICPKCGWSNVVRLG